MNLLTSGNSLRSTDDYVSVTLKNPLWENMVGALHNINPVPKIASKYCAQYNGRYINKTVGCFGTLQTNARDVSLQRNSYEPHDFLLHKIYDQKIHQKPFDLVFIFN